MNLLNHSLSFNGLILFGVILVRYLLIAGGLYWLFYHCLSETFTRLKIQRWPTWKQSIRSDIQLSILSAFVFAIAATVIISPPILGLTRLYTDARSYGTLYLVFSFLLVLILQDTGFYFCHRLFHHPRLFRWCHQGHHRSHSPTPWTSFAFDLPEAIAQVLLIVAIVFVVPVHIGVLLVVLVTMTIWSVFNHLGFALFPSSPVFQWLSQWLIGPQHHVVHHQRYRLHYGLYFTLWDRLLGTQEKPAPAQSHSAIQSPLANPLLQPEVSAEEILSVR